MKDNDVRTIVFESTLRENFRPLSLMRPTFDFLLGTQSQLDRIENSLGIKVDNVAVPKYLEDSTEEKHPDLEVNEDISEKCIAVNSLVSSDFGFSPLLRKYSKEVSDVVLYDPFSGYVVIAFLKELNAKDLARLSTKVFKKQGARNIVFPKRAIIEYPWQFVEENSKAISADFLSIGKKSQNKISGGIEVLGDKLLLGEKLDIGRFVTLDSRYGPIIIEDNAEIQSTSYVTGPCFVGKGSVVKSARIRKGTSIGSNCRISGEVEESVIFDYSNKSHDGFIGHSIVGSWVNIGAMTSNSDLKNTYGKISMKIGEKMVKTDSTKVGILVGDMAKTAIGTMIFSCKKIGVASHIFGTILDDVPSFTMYAKSLGVESTELYFGSALETQKRMMSRRNLQLSDVEAKLMKSVFDSTSKERKAEKVRKGKFQLGS